MKIKAIDTHKYQKKLRPNNNINKLQTNMIQNSVLDSFTKASSPSFSGYFPVVNKKEFNILNQPESKLIELAEIFHKTSDNDIKTACDERYSHLITEMFKNENDKERALAYEKFMPYVEKVREHAQDVEDKISNLNKIAAKGDSNLYKQEDILSKTFFELLKIEQTGRKIPDFNGILVYGNASKADKDEFVDWLKINVPAQIKEFTYDEENPFESIKKIVAMAENAEKIYKIGGKRTILYLKDIDKLLTQDDCIENRRMIGKFKQLAEHCSELYHTTLLINTSYQLDDFEDASIASHRFGNKIKINDGIKQKQKEELKKLQEEKNRLTEAASSVNNYFKYEYYNNEPNDDSGEPERWVEGGDWGDFCDYWKYS